MRIYPNAKINIGLSVTERRTDGYHNLETVFSSFCYLTGTCNSIQNWHAAAHTRDKFFGYRFIDRYLIFLFMIISCFHDTIHKISLIGEKKKTLWLLVQAAYWIYPYRIIQIFCHGYFISLLSGTADNSFRFIKKKQNLFFLISDTSLLKLD